MRTDAFFSRWEIVKRFAKPRKRSLILPREQPADIKVPLVALEAAVGEIVAQPAQLRPNLLHRHYFRVEIDREVLQVRAAHGVNPQRVAAPVQIARVVDVAVEIQIGVARLAHFGLQRAGHLGHGGRQTQSNAGRSSGARASGTSRRRTSPRTPDSDPYRPPRA